jgi:predicted dehydrogenase
MNGESALIIGGGAIGVQHHLPRIRGMMGCTDVCIVEPNATRRTELATDFKGDAGIQIVAEPPDTSPDLVVVATPPKFHLAYFQQYVTRSSMIIIEKPMAMSAAECEAILSAAAQHDVAVFVPMIRRTIPGYKLFRDLLHSGRFGAIRRVTASEGGVFSWQAVSLGSFSHALNGGGVLMDTGPHTLDLLVQIFGDLHCEAAWMDGFAPAVEANCELRLTDDAGHEITLLLSRNRNLSCEIRVEAELAELAIGIRSNRLAVREINGPSYDIFPAGSTSHDDPAFAHLFDDWYRQYPLSSTNSGVGPHDALQLARVIDRAYEIAQPIKGGF